MTRRVFLASTAVMLGGMVGGCRSTSGGKGLAGRRGRFLFVSAGVTYLMNADGTGMVPLKVESPGQVTWQPSAFFSDGDRVLMLSMEARRDGPGRPFEEYYTQTPTHLWSYSLRTGRLEELATRDRMAVFYTPELLIRDERMLVQVVKNRVGQIYNMRLDGSDAREFTRAGEGLPYGTSLSPDATRVAFHLASPSGYQIWTSNLEGGGRTLVAAHKDHLYFGPRWSADGEWLTYQKCHFRSDPGHDRSDVCISRPDGREFRCLTEGQSQWFAATYGRPGLRGGGSNMLSWTRDGAILYSRLSPGAQVPWEYQANRPDTDHFNRDYKPEVARGGAVICRLDPRTGESTPLTAARDASWECRPNESPDGRSVLFCRAGLGEMPSLWIMNARGGDEVRLTGGAENRGADHPRWLPSA